MTQFKNYEEQIAHAWAMFYLQNCIHELNAVRTDLVHLFSSGACQRYGILNLNSPVELFLHLKTILPGYSQTSYDRDSDLTWIEPNFLAGALLRRSCPRFILQYLKDEGWAHQEDIDRYMALQRTFKDMRTIDASEVAAMTQRINDRTLFDYFTQLAKDTCKPRFSPETAPNELHAAITSQNARALAVIANHIQFDLRNVTCQ